ncbi:MAG: hypothetical protein M3347_05450, partial [Armatimonadota bacterium]|nr:hypothetical protein [Armatimonadota bacterium]
MTRLAGAVWTMLFMTLAWGQAADAGGTFKDDLALLKKHTDVIVLSDAVRRAQVAVVPQYQGRVMTSTASGPGGTSFGWINAKQVASGVRQPHINVFGGEDRFWLGPEGGQFAIFFPQGTKFDLEHWQTPAPIDWGGWKVVAKSSNHALFRKEMTLTNYSGFRFNVLAQREVRLLNSRQIAAAFGTKLSPRVRSVAYESVNRITNQGQQPWTKKTGLLSVWILSMFNPSPATTIVVPFKPGPVARLGRIVNDAYFGKVPPDRLVVKANQGVLFFKGDGKYRSKIGIGPQRAKPILGSYDASRQLLTLVQYTLPAGATSYVNSMWEMQKNPYGGDVVNSYNDGPLSNGQQLGPFYELESSSPAAALRPGASLRHVHRTLHLQGPTAELDRIARRTLGVGLAEITGAFRTYPNRQIEPREHRTMELWSAGFQP